MPKKRTRFRFRQAPLLGILLILNLAGGILASQITSIRKVRIVGAESWDRDRLSAIADTLEGKPCAQINRYFLETEVLREPAVEAAEFDRSIFGSAILKVAYRVPVARFLNRAQMALSDKGVIFRCPNIPARCPLIQIEGGTPQTMTTLAQNWPSTSIAQLAIKIRSMFDGQEVRIVFGSGSSLCLNIGSGQAVLGDTGKLDQKLKVLSDKLQQDHDFLSKIKLFNLVDPGNPMAVPK